MKLAVKFYVLNSVTIDTQDESESTLQQLKQEIQGNQ